VLPLKDRVDAERPEVIAMLDGASMVFFSGGNPWHVSKALEGTSFLARMCARLREGMAYAGCSAGVACLTARTYDSDATDLARVFQRGLGLVPDVLFAPHWDIVDDWVPGARAAITAAAAPDTLVAIDEDTAMVGDGTEWDVSGRQAVHDPPPGAADLARPLRVRRHALDAQQLVELLQVPVLVDQVDILDVGVHDERLDNAVSHDVPVNVILEEVVLALVENDLSPLALPLRRAVVDLHRQVEELLQDTNEVLLGLDGLLRARLLQDEVLDPA
jgi:glutamine amidotransferase PdxT